MIIKSLIATEILNDFYGSNDNKYTFHTYISAYINDDLFSETNHK